ncbi:MAG: hypothetical protein KC910_14795 [Candidatus Eremiobacteraeota bacterium]|nr:hypothetical protein [Candidatus Eremiobacteraeota bacterium]
MNNDELFIVANRLDEAARRLLDSRADAPVLLLGESLFGDLARLGDRPLYCVDEEVQELGLASLLDEKIERWRPSEVMEMVCAKRVLNL